MRCPFCSQDNTRVVDSRPVEDNNAIRRRRMCDACGRRFTTYEKVETIPLIVIKKDQNASSMTAERLRQAFSAPAINARSLQSRSQSWSTAWRQRFSTGKNVKFRALKSENL